MKSIHPNLKIFFAWLVSLSLILGTVSPAFADVGLAVKTPLTVANQNVFWGNVTNGSPVGNSLILLQNNAVDKFKVDLNGNITAAGTYNGGTPLVDPMTTIGDIIIRNASNVTARLPGAAGVLHSAVSTAPTWGAVALGSADVSGTLGGTNGGTGVNNGARTITTTGGNVGLTVPAAGATINVAGNFTTTGAYTTSLTQVGSNTYTLPATSGTTLATLTGNEALTNKTINGLTPTSQAVGYTLAGGTTAKTLTMNANLTVSADTTLSGNPMVNPMNTLGDIIYGGAAGAATRLGGVAGVLHSSGAAAPTWAAVALGSVDVSGTLGAGNGGTGNANGTANIAGGTIGAVPYQSAANTTGIVAAGTSGYYLKSNGAAAPTWSQIGLTAAAASVTGILPIANGGTNNANGTANIAGGTIGAIPYQSAANTTAVLAAGTAGQLLQSGGAGAPSWVNAPAGVSGGTASYVARFTGATTLSTGVIYDNATNVGIGTNAPGATYKVDIEDANMADYALYGSAGLGIWAHSSRNASGGIALTADCLGGTASNCDYAIKGLGGYQGAILGQTTNSAASAFGVGGISQYGPGVSGNGGTTGVQGSGPIGVYGGGTTYGVEGYTTAGSSYGVYGLNSGGSVGYGVYGAATGNSGTGVWGNVSGSNSYAVIANAATGNGSYNFYTNTNAPSVFLGNIGFGTSAPQTPIDVMGGYTNIQGVGINNAWVGNNFYYNGSNFVFETSGYASAGLYYEPSGMIDMRVSSASGTAGQTISWVTAFSISGAGSGTTGRVNIPNTLTIGSSATVNQAGDIGVSRNAAPASGVIYLGNNGGRYLFYDGSSYYLNGASLYVNSTLYPSDVRLKRDVTPLQDSLNKILALQGVNYKWNRQVLPDRDLPAGPQIGFIAQDVEKIIPEVVSTDGSGYEAIDYSKITPVLAEAIKEQQKQIDELRAEVESLKK